MSRFFASRARDPMSSWTHFWGALASVLATVLMLTIGIAKDTPAVLVAGAPWIWPFVLHRKGVVALYVAVTYASALPAGAVVYRLDRLLRSAADADGFTDANARRLRAVSWCLAAAGLG